MFEKPQYLTPNGYRRLSARPKFRKPSETALVPVKPATGLAAARQRLQQKNSRQGKGISKEAAMLIALALKSMMRQR